MRRQCISNIGLAVSKILHPGQLAAVLLAVSLASATQALSDIRIAFVLGIDKYDKLPEYRKLTRSVQDAQDLEGEFSRLGFIVTLEKNLSRSDFNKEWQIFLDKVRKDDTVAVFLSGHGVEIEGHNFFLPSDIPFIEFGRQEQLKRESVSIDELLSA